MNIFLPPEPINHSIPRKFQECVKTHKITTAQEMRKDRTETSLKKVKIVLSKEERSANAKFGKTVTPKIEQVNKRDSCYCRKSSMSTYIKPSN